MNTLQDEDELTGSGDSASLDATLGNAGDNGATTITPTLTDIKTVDVAFTGSDAAEAVTELDLQDATGIDTINVTRVSDGAGTATLDNLQDVLSTLSIKNSGEDNDAISVVFDDDVLDGTSDVLAFTADDVEVNNLEIDGEDDEGYETINVTASGDLSANFFAIDETETLDLSGSGDVTIGNFADDTDNDGTANTADLSRGHLSAFNASDATGVFDVDLGAANVVEATNAEDSGTEIGFVYTGSQGNDTVRVDEDSLSNDGVTGEDDDRNDTVDGGTGQNTLLFTLDKDLGIDTAAPDERNGLVEDEHTVSNIQTVRIEADDDAAAGNNLTNAGLDASTVGGLTTLELRNISDDDEADFDVINLGSAFNGGAGVVDVFHAADQTTAHTESDTDVQVHLADATGDDDTVTVHVETAENTNEQFDFTLDVEGNDADQADLFDEAVESVTLVDNDTEDNSVGLTSASEHTGTLTLSGGRADDTFTSSSTIVAATVAATAQASDVTLDLGDEDQDVNMGSGDDTLNFTTADKLTDDDDIDGGDGSDTISAGFTGDSDSDLNVANVEQVNLDAGANVTVDLSESDDITTVGIVSDDEAVTTPVNANVITLSADAIATIDYIDTSADEKNGNEYNGLTISEEDDTSPAAVTVNVADSDDQTTDIGILTLDSSTTSLTINTEDDDGTQNTTFDGIVAAGLTSLTVTDAYSAVDHSAGDTDYETEIDLDDTTDLTSVDATEAFGGIDLTVDSLADGATVDLQNVDDTDGDANDAVTVTFGTDTGADDVTFTGGAGEETITITNGDLDGLSVNVAGGNDTVTLTGASGENTEIDGGAGADTLTGSDSGDEISGGAGGDTIAGGTGADTLSGGAGNDVFTYITADVSGGDTDALSDFDAAGTDTFQFDIGTKGDFFTSAGTAADKLLLLADSAAAKTATGVNADALTKNELFGGTNGFASLAAFSKKLISNTKLTKSTTALAFAISSNSNALFVAQLVNGATAGLTADEVNVFTIGTVTNANIDSGADVVLV